MHNAPRLLLPLALAAVLAACGPGQAPAGAAPATAPEAPAPAGPTVEGVSGTHVIDPEHTTVIAQWNHFGFSNPVANFGQAEGTIVFDADDVAASSVEVTLPLSGLAAFATDFNEHLWSADFFDAGRFPASPRSPIDGE